MSHHVSSVRQYLDDLFGPEESPFTEIRALMRSSGMPPIGVHPRLGRLLAFLVRLSRAQRVLEIGTLGGLSAAYMARALPLGGFLLTIEKAASSAEVARRSFSVANVQEKVRIEVGNALEILPSLPRDPFDLLFLDAEKAEYSDYLTAAWPLLRSGSLIVADDILRRGKPIEGAEDDPTANGLKRFNRFLANDPRLETVMLPDIADYSWGGLDGIALAMVR